MGRILEYVILLSNLSVILGTQLLHKKPLSPYKYERPKGENFTFHTVRQFHPKDHQNDFFGGATNKDKIFQGRRSLPLKNVPRTNHMFRTLGLQAFSSENFDGYKGRQSRNGFGAPNHSSRLSEVHTFSQNNSRNWKNIRNPSGRVNYSKSKTWRPPSNYDQNNSNFHHSKKPENPEKLNSFRRDYNNGRNPRLFNHKHTPKVCDPCNNVPWVPLFKESNSYRQQRNQVTTNVFNAPSTDISFDHSAYASINHNVLLPPTPLIPPLEPIYDGTISSSFGLPIGNIPTSHGLLAPINHLAPKINRYGANSINYINSIKYYPPHSILDTNPFPELSPVPIVPIHDAGQFYQMDSTIASLVPPTTATAGVSNVVLTISEGNSGHGQPSQGLYSESGKNHKVVGKDQNSESSSTVNVQSGQTGNNINEYQQNYNHDHNHNHNHNYGELEIVKSIPVAEFSSSGDYSVPLLHIPNSDPGNLSHFLDGIFIDNHQVSQKATSENVHHSSSNLDFLVPPVIQQPQGDTTFNSSVIKPFMNPPISTELRPSPDTSFPPPKPLNSASLSWLFSDHTAISGTEPNHSEPTSHPFITDNQEIASVVNNELRPVFSPSPSPSSPLPSSSSPIHSFPSSPSPIHSFPIVSSNSQNGDNSKNKKIQIIIPYTTKNKNSFDNNELESVQHEVYQSPRTPVNKSSKEGNSSNDSATPHLQSPGNVVSETNTEVNKKSSKESQKDLNFDAGKKIRGDQGPEIEPTDNTRKYLSEMHHIIAKNIRELLRGEIDKTRDQSNRLQSNIDNWTALEYSNHKTVEGKAPKEIISQALTVTSIPGTSISHSLLPSKKIPNEYFITTPLPVYEEPNTVVFNTANVSVNSRPFTARPYATTNLYFPATKGPEENKKSSEVDQNNHEKNYTDVGKNRVNNWGRLNENLVLPEAKSISRKFEEATTSSDWSARMLSSSSVGNEKVQIVTPVSLTSNNYTVNTFRRTTRHIRTTEKPPPTTTTTTAATLKSEIKMPTFETNKNSFIHTNTTRLEKVSNVTSPFKKYFSVEVRNSSSTSSSGGSELTEDNVSDVRPYSTLPSAPVRNVFSEVLTRVAGTNRSDQLSINDIFPFRNKELPWESVLNITEPVYQNFRQRKSLIKQVKLGKTKTTEEDSS